MKHFCAQRGCSFELEPMTVPAELADDGVTVLTPAEMVEQLAPELCPVCGHPFVEHPAPDTL